MGVFLLAAASPFASAPSKKRTVAATPRRPGVEQVQMMGDARPDVDGEVVGGRIGWRGGEGEKKNERGECDESVAPCAMLCASLSKTPAPWPPSPRRTPSDRRPAGP